MKTLRLRQAPHRQRRALRGRLCPPSSPRPSAQTLSGQLRWRHIGPEGNRVSAVAGVPGDPLVYYAGSASGGIFKTMDGGASWEPIFDGQPVHSIGDIAVAPSDPSTVWAGTGEACIRSHISVGEGIFKSTDAGRTGRGWGSSGPAASARSSSTRRTRTSSWPARSATPTARSRNAACSGRPTAARPGSGCCSWTRTPDARRWPWIPRIRASSSPACGRSTSRPGDARAAAQEAACSSSNDGGATWTRLRGRGLPARDVGKVEVAIAPSNPNRVYALIETGDGVRGRARKPIAARCGDRTMAARTGRWSATTAMPWGGRITTRTSSLRPTTRTKPTSSRLATACRSTAAQRSTRRAAAAPGGDNHDMWIDPTNPKRMIVGNDGGPSISLNRGRTW